MLPSDSDSAKTVPPTSPNAQSVPTPMTSTRRLSVMTRKKKTSKKDLTCSMLLKLTSTAHPCVTHPNGSPSLMSQEVFPPKTAPLPSKDTQMTSPVKLLEPTEPSLVSPLSSSSISHGSPTERSTILNHPSSGKSTELIDFIKLLKS